MEVDAFIDQFRRFLRGRLAVNGTGFGFAIVNLACFFGERVADVVAVFLDVFFQFMQRFDKFCRLPFRRRHNGIRGTRVILALSGAGNVGRHQRLADVAIAAHRARHDTGFDLFAERVRVLEPALEDMVVAATDIEYNHDEQIKVDLAFAKFYFFVNITAGYYLFMVNPPPISSPSPWVDRFIGLVRKDGAVLDLACGSGRHVALIAGRGHRVTAVDRDVSRLAADAELEIVEADLEGEFPWPLPGRRFDGIVVANYLHRPLFPVLIDSLSSGGVLIYETFAVGNEKSGRPRNPDFLLRNGELLDAFAGTLSVVAYESGAVEYPAPAVIQRIAAVKPDDGELPITLPA